MIQLVSRILVFFATLFVGSSSLQGEEKKELAISLWAGWDQARQHIESGEYRATGREAYTDAQGKPEESSDIDYVGFFNFPEGCQRADISVWGPSCTGAWAVSPNGLVQWLNHGKGSVVSITPRHSRRLPWAKFVDPRSVGFAYPGDYSGLESAFTKRDERLAELGELQAVEELDDGRHRLTYEGVYPRHPDLHYENKIIINAQRGFTVESWSKRNFKSVAESEVFESKYSWDSFNEIYVPIQASCSGRQARYNIDLRFEWRQLNEEIGIEQFGYKALPVSKGRLIVDNRHVTPVILGRFGVTTQDDEIPAFPSSPWSGSRTLIVLNIIFMVFCVGYFLLRTRSVKT